jgi:hypothetical protein
MIKYFMREKKSNKYTLSNFSLIWKRILDLNENDHCLTVIIRTFFWLINIITCGFIIANCIRHWN